MVELWVNMGLICEEPGKFSWGYDHNSFCYAINPNRLHHMQPGRPMDLKLQENARKDFVQFVLHDQLNSYIIKDHNNKGQEADNILQDLKFFDSFIPRNLPKKIENKIWIGALTNILNKIDRYVRWVMNEKPLEKLRTKLFKNLQDIQRQQELEDLEKDVLVEKNLTNKNLKGKIQKHDQVLLEEKMDKVITDFNEKMKEIHIKITTDMDQFKNSVLGSLTQLLIDDTNEKSEEKDSTQMELEESSSNSSNEVFKSKEMTSCWSAFGNTSEESKSISLESITSNPLITEAKKMKGSKGKPMIPIGEYSQMR